MPVRVSNKLIISKVPHASFRIAQERIVTNGIFIDEIIITSEIGKCLTPLKYPQRSAHVARARTMLRIMDPTQLHYMNKVSILSFYFPWYMSWIFSMEG